MTLAVIFISIRLVMISETKLDLSFPKGQFHLLGFFSEPYRFDRIGNSGGIFVFICENMPSILIESQMRIEGFFLELNLKRKTTLMLLL